LAEYGDYVLAFIALNKPIATIFIPYCHILMKTKKIVHAIVDLSDRIIVLTKKSQEILTSHYVVQ
jgi:hypothetical protein